jgi:basic amino acid/polyamine antiporter, APA family
MFPVRQPTLVRAIGRWSLAALSINCIIGSGVFGLPSLIATTVGNASPFAWLSAAAVTGLVMGCFAEVASRFEQSGGVYLYSRVAFGRTTGIAAAWFGLLARLTAIAANANLFVIYLAQFWPRASALAARTVVLFLLFGFLTAVNYLGVRGGTRLSNLFTAVKLITLCGFIAGGLLYLAVNHRGLIISAPTGPPAKWFHSILLLMFAYGGYETALMPAGEVKDPRRDYPFALFVALATCAFVYTMAQWIVISVVPVSSMSDRPMASAVQAMIGPWGAGVVSVAILVACFGYLSANILGFPRILFALAEQGDVPAVMARVHPRFRTPYVAIVILSACAFLFALAGSFQWNVTISAVSRLIYYGLVCAALPVLRRRNDVPDAHFRLPLGNLVAVLALAVSLLLFPRSDRRGLPVMAVLVVCILANSLWAARRSEVLTVRGPGTGNG